MKERLIFVFLFVMFHVHPSFVEAEPQADKSEQIKVGMLLTLSGSFATAGEDCRKGIEAALANTGKEKEFHLLFADSKNEPSTAVAEFRKLTQIDGALAIYTHRSSMGMALNPISASAKIPLLGAVGHKDFASGNKFAFQVWPKSGKEGAFVAEVFLRQNFKRAAIISTEDDWTSAIAEGFRQRYSELGANLVFDQSVLLKDRDFRTLLTKIKQRSADVIYVNVLLPQIGPLIRQAKELGISLSLFSNFYTARSDVLESAGLEALEGVQYVEMDTNLPSLKKRLGLSAEAYPQGLTVASYVATTLLVQAISSMNATNPSSTVYSALLAQNEVVTPDHVFAVVDRVVEFPLVVKEIRDGKGHEVER